MGRPLTWEDPVAFEKSVEDYFEIEKQPTWTGLAIHLGFASRDSLNDYKKKEGFSDPIKKVGPCFIFHFFFHKRLIFLKLIILYYGIY